MRGYKSIESSPRVGDLKNLIEIGRTENTTNENGYPGAINETVICKVWAAALDGGSPMTRAADTEVAQPKIKFVMRYRDDIRSGMWVRFRNEKHTIESVGEYAFGRTYMILTTSNAKGVGQ